MRDFTYEETIKLFNEIKENREIPEDILADYINEYITDISNEDLANNLDISISTANNWLTGRNNISQLGKQAIGFQILLKVIICFMNHEKKNIIVKKGDLFDICYPKDNLYHSFATTTDYATAKFILLKNTIQKQLKDYEDILDNEYDIRKNMKKEGWQDNWTDVNYELNYYSKQYHEVKNTLDYISQIDIQQNSPLKKEQNSSLEQNTPKYIRNISFFERICKEKYKNCPYLSDLILDILKNIKGNYSLERGETKWISSGELKNFLAIKLQNKNICLFVKDKQHILNSDKIDIKPDRHPYVRFTIDSLKQKDDAIRIINKSIENA